MNWFKKHPRVEVKPSQADQLLYRAGWMVVAVNVFLVWGVYFDLPDTIPTHFNFQGQVDGYGHKSALWAIPMLSAGLYLALGLIATKLKPWLMNYPVKVTEENAPKLYPSSNLCHSYLRLAGVSSASSFPARPAGGHLE